MQNGGENKVKFILLTVKLKRQRRAKNSKN